MRTLLLFPAFGEPYSRYPPLGIAYLAAVLRANQYQVEVIEAAKYKTIEEYAHELAEKAPHVLGISVLSVHYEKALVAARVAKQVLPDLVIVFGGAHPTALPNECLKNPEVDIVVVGEGERTFLRLVEAIAEGRELESIPGICFRGDTGIVHTREAAFIERLDSLPFPARDMLPMREHLRQAPTLPLPYPSTSIMPSRGCFGNCRFCQPMLRKLFGRKMRYRSPANVVDEIAELKAKYKIRGLSFADDEPTWNREWMIEFCEEMIRRQVKVRWICPSRVDTVDREALKLMRRAGCIQVGFGVETGSQRILDYYRKGTRVEQVPKAFEMCREAGIITRANIMVGAPDETAEDVQETITLIQEVKPDLVATSVTTPIVGSDLFSFAQENQLLRKVPLSAYNRFDIATMKRHLSDEEIRRFIQKIVRVYWRSILMDLATPLGLIRRKPLLHNVLMHWITMISNPVVLARDVLYHLRYARKEYIS